MGIFAHREQILRHHAHWDNKPALQRVYLNFYRIIAFDLTDIPNGKVVELGSGIGNIKMAIPHCITTDMFPTPWSERVENAYHMTFADGTVSDLILVDVFHHLQYPGTALREFHRVLQTNGRVHIFEPCISVLGAIVFGLFHDEGLRSNHAIQWLAPTDASLESPEYYTSQGNATRVFLGHYYHNEHLQQWSKIEVRRLSALSYLATGGYTKPQFLPGPFLSILRPFERLLDYLPALFATRMLVTLSK